jgi:hypothetical protein
VSVWKLQWNSLCCAGARYLRLAADSREEGRVRQKRKCDGGGAAQTKQQKEGAETRGGEKSAQRSEQGMRHRHQPSRTHSLLHDVLSQAEPASSNEDTKGG